MFRKVSITLLIAGVILVVGNITIAAQTAPVSGTVVMQKADGTTEPVAGALIEVFRTDMKTGAPSVKTGKKGDFTFAGLLLQGTYMFSVSAANASPTIYPGIRAGAEKLVITLSPGDGRKFTENEARTALAGASTNTTGTTKPAEMSAEDKKAQAEYEAKKKEIEDKNAKAMKTNEIVAAALKAGNDAYMAKNYDLAVTKYDEGISADPTFVGTAPVLLNNRGAALLARATDTYNKGVRSTDPTEAVANKVMARQDLTAAADGYLKAWTLMKTAPPTDATEKANFDATKLNTLNGSKDLFRIAARTEQVEPGLIESAKVLLPEFIAIQTDAAKKAEAQMIIADLYRVSGDYQGAIDAYKSVLAASPDNPDALAMIGVCYYALGASNNSDKAMYQEGANYLQKYVSVAPEGHRYKKEAADILDALKKENVTPQKVAPTGKKRGS